MRSTKENVARLRHAVQQMLELLHIESYTRADIRVWAKQLAAQEDCHYVTAKRHLIQALQQRQEGAVKPRARGGARPGAGQPRKEST